MAKEGSVAPKERINIVYKPSTGDAKEEIELPLKLLIIGDFTQRQDDTQLESRPMINIDKDNFNDVLRGQNLNLSVNVANTLAGDGGELPVHLKIQTLKDFDPESVARQVPELNKMLELREALMALRGPLGNVPAFRRRLQNIVSDEQTRTKLMTELGIGEEDKK
ncbi:MAG: type VI secretion system contractile sheath small subunit [Gammaproteobacteria bacterium]|nr:type VI secretion system contractile sheath small subunit [Gammaproteobacteria bacterium]